eukprot:TRINITY_DN8434_c0_g3_i1.p2 TRINITY_DN8434_c0_g3~~TRINITY_DN8434_c0_g3_i1.p2  ORF type:complete len:106 (-),score=13.03 TRINITY_DN8434_c0_g3_i1:717-1034(-)
MNGLIRLQHFYRQLNFRHLFSLSRILQHYPQVPRYSSLKALLGLSDSVGLFITNSSFHTGCLFSSITSVLIIVSALGSSCLYCDQPVSRAREGNLAAVEGAPIAQ